MTVSISTCPKCNSTVFPDTVQCPHCDHILQENSVNTEASIELNDEIESNEIESNDETDSSEIPAPQGLISDDSSEQICPSCNEGVRIGLVRCWNCGTFMREDIAAKFCELQANPAPIIYSQLPETEKENLLDTGEFHLVSEEEEEEDGFEVADDVQMIQGVAEDVIPATTEEAYSVGSTESVGNTEEVEENSESETAENAEAAPEIETETDEKAENTEETDDKEKATSLKEPEDIDGEASLTDNDDEEETAQADNSASKEESSEETLLDVAIREEKERNKLIKEKKKKPLSGFLVFCPNGHRIEVQDKHRGKSGKCPKCSSPFTVPKKKWKAAPKVDAPPVQEEGDVTNAPPKIKTVAGDFQKWMEDLRLHVVDPTRLKLKADSLKGAFSTIDLGLAPEKIILVDYNLKAGLFGVTDKDKVKKKEARDAVWEHISDKKYMDDLPVKIHHLFEAELFRDCRVVFPAPKSQDSMFAGIPVFGKGMIAVRIPSRAEGNEIEFISFNLSGFREFSQNMNELYEIDDLGEGCGLPLTDEFEEAQCHYSDVKFKYIPDETYYQDDEGFDVIIVGRRCSNCGLEVSEDARKKEKIGGANGKGIAKAKCPKCKAKFGSATLYSLANAEEIIEKAKIAQSQADELAAAQENSEAVEDEVAPGSETDVANEPDPTEETPSE